MIGLRRGRRSGGSLVFGLFFAGFATLFMAVGAWQAEVQRSRLVTFVRTTAVVEAAEVEVNRDSDGATYRPAISYRFFVDDEPWVSDRVTPLALAASQSWAEGLLALYPVDQSVSVWYDPTDPSESYIHPYKDFFPYVFVFFPLIFISVGMAIAIGGGRERLPVKLALIGIVNGIVGLVGMGHYWITPGEASLFGMIVTVILAMVVMGLLWLAKQLTASSLTGGNHE